MAGERKDLQDKHDGGSSITQDGYGRSAGRPAKPYTSGANVGSGKGPGPSEQAIAAGPKSGHKGT